MGTDFPVWALDLVEIVGQWSEFCRAAASGERVVRDKELFVARQVGHPHGRILAVVDPDSRHISVLGVGIYPKLRELHRLALHAFRSGRGEVLFPPLTVRMGGADVRFRIAGHGCIFGYADAGTEPPRVKDPAVVLATRDAGLALAAIHDKRMLVIAQGRPSEIAGLDLDRMRIWEKLPTEEVRIQRLPPSDRIYAAPGAGRPGPRSGRGARGTYGAPALEDPERLEAALSAALQASVIDEIPVGRRGRRDASDFLLDVVHLAVRGEPNFTGTSGEIAARIGKVRGRRPRSARTTATILGLLEQHGERHSSEVLASRPNPHRSHRWTLHFEEIADPESPVCKSLFSRWSTLHAVLAGDDEPVTEEEVTRMKLRGGLGGAFARKRHDVPYMFDSGMVQEWTLRRKRERELMRVQIQHGEQMGALRDELASVRRQLEEAIAENTRHVAHRADADARLERLQERC